MRALLSLTLLCGAFSAAAGEAPVPLFPDIIIRESTLYDHDIVTNIVPGRRHLRLSNATANIGIGKLYLYGVNPGGGQTTQDIMQRVYIDDGNFYDRAAGQFVYHSGHNHIHVEDWTVYRLREILPQDGVGQILAAGAKTSFCILDLQIYDTTLPGFPPNGEFNSCSTTVQGLSVGWADIYSKNLTGQNIDITGIPDGEYWLEAVVDPDDNVFESDEGNNAGRIKVTIGSPTPISPDPYEPNQSRAELDLRPMGGINSPALGPCAPTRVVNALTVHQTTNDDWYRFYIPSAGTSNDFVRIEFLDALGDLDMTLVNAAGTTQGTSTSSSNVETISLNGKPAGYYDLRVYGYSGATNPEYRLSIDPPANGAPQITVLNPPPGEILVQQGVETYTATWSVSDAESNPTWVNIYVNHEPVLNAQAIHLSTSTNTPGAYGLHVINTSELTLGRWYVYAEVSDGGTVSGAWSEGRILLWDPAVPAPSQARLTRLHEPAPNPFNPRTVLRLELESAASSVDWAVFDVRGARVKTLEDGPLAAGLHERIFTSQDESGHRLASGVYFVRARIGSWQQSAKIVLAQ